MGRKPNQERSLINLFANGRETPQNVVTVLGDFFRSDQQIIILQNSHQVLNLLKQTNALAQ